MKSKKLIILVAMLVLGITYQVSAENTIKDPARVIFSVNNKQYNNQDVYKTSYDIRGFTSMLNKLDGKYFSQKYANDPRLAAKKAAKIKEINASGDKASEFRLYNVTNVNDYLMKSNEMTNVYRELASMDGAYEKIYNKSDIDYMYENKISGNAKLWHILITANASGSDIDSNKALNEARNKALEIIEKIKKGQTFVAAINENNHGNNKAGYLGVHNVETATNAHLDKNLVKAAFKLKDKEVSEPIESTYGYEIAYVEYTKEKPTFEAAKNEISQKLWDIYSSQNPYFQSYALTKAREIAGIDVEESTFKSQYANAILKAKSDFVRYDPTAQPELQ